MYIAGLKDLTEYMFLSNYLPDVDPWTAPALIFMSEYVIDFIVRSAFPWP
jgi:hypothetical protein